MEQKDTGMHFSATFNQAYNSFTTLGSNNRSIWQENNEELLRQWSFDRVRKADQPKRTAFSLVTASGGNS